VPLAEGPPRLALTPDSADGTQADGILTQPDSVDSTGSTHHRLLLATWNVRGCATAEVRDRIDALLMAKGSTLRLSRRPGSPLWSWSPPTTGGWWRAPPGHPPVPVRSPSPQCGLADVTLRVLLQLTSPMTATSKGRR
jgi:hypothetical protein